MSELLTRRLIDALEEELTLEKEFPDGFFSSIEEDMQTYVHLSVTTEHNMVIGQSGMGSQATALFLRSVSRHFLKHNLKEIDWDEVEFILKSKQHQAAIRRQYEDSEIKP